MMARFLSRLAGFCGRRAWIVLAAALSLGGLGAWAVQARLGVSTDTGALFSAALPWKQRQATLRAAFPRNEELLVVVIDGAIPEEADATAAALAAALRGEADHFISVWRPDASPFLERNALLYLSVEALQALLERMIDAQPFLGALAADPSLRGLAGALALIAEGVQRQAADLGPFDQALRAINRSLSETGPGAALSWQALLAGPLTELAGRYRFVLAKPKLDYGALEPGARAQRAIRAAAATLPFVQSGAARVRITGSVALDDDEFASVANGAAVGLLGSLALVLAWLFIAVRSWRLVVPIVLTLLLGLVLTAAFAAVAVGTLNLVSVAFAVLFVGLAVDFAIQFAVRFRDVAEAPEPLAEAGRRSGTQILLAALAIAAGFLAFTPTSFAGVAQLGLIAGVGMLIAFACTMTALPALIALFRAEGRKGEAGFAWARPADAWMARRRRWIIAGFGALALLGLGLSPWVRFDSDPLHTKNQASESVRTLNDLAADPVTNPYAIEVLEPSLAAAAALAPKLKAQPLVDDVLSLDSLVPGGQAEKLPLIADAASILTATLSAPAAAAPDASALRAGLRRAAPPMLAASALLPAGAPFAAVAKDLETLAAADDGRLLEANAAVSRFLPMQLARLRTALRAGPVTRADIPADLARDWMTPDGRAKLQVMPKRSAYADNGGLQRFVAQVTALAPGAGGAAVTIVRSAETIIAAFRTAAIAAVAAIAVILLAALRRWADVALVLAPLLLSGLMTAAVIVALPLPLNFANIIALPLLLGVGVSFNVYFVMNWRAGEREPLSSANARAVLFSALTTATAFGSLALSSHPGTASMGALLLVSLGCTLAASLGFMPAVLAWMDRGRG